VPGGRHALHHPCGRALGRDAAGDDRALRDGIDLAVRPIERRHHQRAAQQAFCIANCRNRDINPPAGPGEGWQVGGDENRRHILRPIFFPRDVDAQPLQQV
jgi:hypothetical protein